MNRAVSMKAGLDNRRHYGLDLIRGLCAVSVAAYHFMSWQLAITIESIGAFGVYMFFILSATTMMLRYAGHFSYRLEALDLGDFFRNRAARILPLLGVVSFVTAADLILVGVPWIPTVERMILTGSGLFSRGVPGLFSGVTGAWSLGIELVFYLAFPVLALFAIRASRRRLALTMIILMIGQQLSLAMTSEYEMATLWSYYVSPLTFAPYFLAGIMIFKEGGERTPAFLALALCTFGLIFSYSLVRNTDLYRSHVDHMVLTGMSCITVWAAYRSTLPRWLLPAAAFLGEISYALYLVHPLVNRPAAGIASLFPQLPWVNAVAFVLLSLGVATLVNRFFERPVRQFFRRAAT